MIRQLLAFFLSFALIFSSTSALAASPAGWSVSPADVVMNGATATINAFKGAGSTALKATIAHKPAATAVGKQLIKGGGSVALAYAMVELLDAGIDWVLDPENNAVKYKPNAAAGEGDAGTGAGTGALMFCKWHEECDAGVYNYSSAEAAGRATCARYKESYVKISGIQPFKDGDWFTVHCVRADGSADLWSGRVKANPAYDPDAPPAGGVDADGYKSIPINTVASKVLANAEAGHTESQDFVKAVAVGAVDAGELDTALDAVAEPTTDTANPDAPPTDPTKPFDPSGILDALKKILSALGLLSLLGTISDSLTAMLEWFKGEPEGKPEDNKIDIPEPPLPDIDSTISFGGACPADLGADFNLYGTNFNFVLMPFSKLCPLLSTFVKPTLILLGSFMAVAIVGGRKDA